MNRLGRFSIGIEHINRDPETVLAIMAQCIVVRCEMLYERKVLEYVAISSKFDEVPTGMSAPEYSIHMHENNIEFKRL